MQPQTKTSPLRPPVVQQQPPKPANSAPPKTKTEPYPQDRKGSLWVNHLRSLIGKQVLVQYSAGSDVRQVEGTLKVIAFDHMSVALEDGKSTLTIKNVVSIRASGE